MFSLYHFIWIGICTLLIAVSLVIIFKKQVTLKQFLPICCFVSAASEIVKTFSLVEMVPSSDGSAYYAYLDLKYLPFHMCSLLLFVIFYITYGKNENWKNKLTGFVYAAGILGGIMGILLTSIFSSVVPAESFHNALAYQTFIYHSMLIVLGVLIYHDKNSVLTSHHYKTTLIFVGTLSFLSLYLNSWLSAPVYENSVLKSVEYTTNFFFTYRTPIGISLTTKTQWYIYLAILIALAVVLVTLVYIPVFKRDRKKLKQMQENA